jgi:peptidoglycan/xylan/chitin deacetylase (PgdA/CDA1 family)
MYQRIFAICATSLLLGLVACSNNTVPSGDVSPASSQADTALASQQTSPSVSPSPSPSVSDKTEPSATPEPVEAAKTYRMNKAFSIVPIDKEKTENKVVLLTFDDGPKDHETLDPLLDTLDKHHAKAIFFVNGYRVKEHPELLKEIDDRKQVIGNHSWDHIELKKEKAAKIKEQIEKVQDIVKEITGKSPVFFRPPFASANDAVHQIAKDNRLLFMTWSNGSLDWALKKVPEANKPQAIIDNVLEQLHPGSNILMHELPWTAAALDKLLTELEKKGYSFVDPNAIDTKL